VSTPLEKSVQVFEEKHLKGEIQNSVIHWASGNEVSTILDH
jgi:hypothetical protein